MKTEIVVNGRRSYLNEYLWNVAERYTNSSLWHQRHGHARSTHWRCICIFKSAVIPALHVQALTQCTNIEFTPGKIRVQIPSMYPRPCTYMPLYVPDIGVECCATPVRFSSVTLLRDFDELICTMVLQRTKELTRTFRARWVGKYVDSNLYEYLRKIGLHNFIHVIIYLYNCIIITLIFKTLGRIYNFMRFLKKYFYLFISENLQVYLNLRLTQAREVYEILDLLSRL